MDSKLSPIYVCCIENGNYNKVIDRKPAEKRPLEKPKNLRIILKWVLNKWDGSVKNRSSDGNHWRILGDNSNDMLSVIKCGEFGEYMEAYWLFNN
jgi:hypothetical protein